MCWKKKCVDVARRGQSFQQSIGSLDKQLKTVFVDHFNSKWTSIPTLCSGFTKFLRVSPSRWQSFVVPWTRNLIYYLTRLILHRVYCPNGLEPLRWFETSFSGFENRLVKCRSYEVCHSKKFPEKHEEEPSKAAADKEVVEENYIYHDYYTRKNSKQKFFNIETSFHKQKTYNSNGHLITQVFQFNFKGDDYEYKNKFALWIIWVHKNSWWAFWREPYFTKRLNVRSRPDSLMLQ